MIRVVLSFVTLLCTVGLAGAEGRTSLWPELPVATGEPHPEGNEFWRKRHMDLMKHDRDKTLREGERDIQASLKECFDCHLAKDDHGDPVTYEDERHFCRTCHDFVAVKVDCFTCHRSTPDGFDEGAASHARLFHTPTDENEILEFLRGLVVSSAMAVEAEVGE